MQIIFISVFASIGLLSYLVGKHKQQPDIKLNYANYADCASVRMRSHNKLATLT